MANRGIFPAAKLTPAPFGLFSVADVKRHGISDGHWIEHFSQESEACAFDASIIDVCGGEDPIEVFNTTDADRWIDVVPFGIIAKDTCLSVGWSVQDRKARVIRQLELITPKAVETELWNGQYVQARNTTDALPDPETGMYLASNSATTVVAGAQRAKVGLALLEQALASCSSGFQGTIHMSPLVAAMIGMELQVEDDHLITNNGNAVVVGPGYDGRGPGDSAAPADGSFVHWMYATGPVFVHLGSNELITVTEGQATNTATNEMTYVAERPASVHWDGCCHFAVQVDIRL
jgi:hypothetical protein